MTFRSNKRHGHKRSNSFSNDRGRNKGNITQQYQKYLKLAKEASSSGDRVQSEYYYQFADHYSRLMLELGIVFEDIETNQESITIKLNDQKNDNNENSNIDTGTSEDIKYEELKNDEEESDRESIDSVSFISQPAKKKLVKTKKESV